MPKQRKSTTAKPRRHRRADVGTHDDADGLRQLHNAGIDKTDYHDRGCRGALNDRRDTGAEQNTAESAGRQPLQNAL